MTTVHYPDGEVVMYRSYKEFYIDRYTHLIPNSYITTTDFCYSTGNLVIRCISIPRDDPEPDHVVIGMQ